MHVEIQDMKCCGIKEIKGLNQPDWTPQKFLKAIIQKIPHYKHRARNKAGFAAYFLVFAEKQFLQDRLSGNTFQTPWHRSRLRRFKKYIERNGLGTIEINTPVINPVYGKARKLHPALWIPNNPAIVDFAHDKGWLDEDAMSNNMKSVYYVHSH